MPSKKATTKIVKNTELDDLKNQLEEVSIQNKAFAAALKTAVENAELDSQMWNSNLKALLIRLGGNITLDHVTVKAANNPNLNVLQEYNEAGGCKYMLVMKGTDEK